MHAENRYDRTYFLDDMPTELRQSYRTYAIGVIPVKLVLAKAGNGNPGR